MDLVLLAQLGVIGVTFFMLLNSAAIMVLVERKVCAFLQQRLGPTRVGPWGVLQPLADIVKLIFKEELRPKAADAFLFTLAPMISAVTAFAVWPRQPDLLLDLSGVTWTAPSDFLLDTPGSEYLRRLPTIEIPPVPNVADATGGDDTSRRNQ